MRYPSIYHFLWAMIRPYKWHYAVMLIVPILSALYDFANNYALKLLVDAFSIGKDISYHALWWPIGLYIGAQILLDLMWRISDVIEWRSEPYVRESILLKVYNTVQHNPYSYFQNRQSGAITSKAKGILDGYDHVWESLHHTIVPKMANALVLTVTLAVVSFKVCFFVATWEIIFFLVMYRFSTIIGKLSFITADHRHRIFGLVADNIANIFTIFSFSARKREFNRLKQMIKQDFTPSSIRVYKFNFKSNIFAAFSYCFMLSCLLLYMIHLLQTAQNTTGDIVFVMSITSKIAWELWELVHRMQDYMKNFGDFKSAFELLQNDTSESTTVFKPNDSDETFQSKALKVLRPSIVFENVSFAYEPDRLLFSDLSLKIKPGEKVGLVGTSGAGKTSLVSLLLKYFKINDGRILIDNHDIAEYSADTVRAHISLIPQDILLFHRSILDNILYGNPEASEKEAIIATRMANIHDFILSLPEQYQTLVGERGVKLSGGQRQRIAIARAILKNAPILILDEATSSLDTETEHLIQTSLNKLLENSNTTVLAIAHRLSTLKHMDRIIVLDNGKIIEEGTHNALIRRDSVYKRLWDLQQI